MRFLQIANDYIESSGIESYIKHNKVWLVREIIYWLQKPGIYNNSVLNVIYFQGNKSQLRIKTASRLMPMRMIIQFK